MKKADGVLIAVVAVVVIVLLIFLYGVNKETGSYVQIEVDGKVVDILPIDADTRREISSDNNGKNILVIENSSAKMIEASCPDKICTNHKEINRVGESIICLPNKVVVTIVGDNSNSDIDAVA